MHIQQWTVKKNSNYVHAGFLSVCVMLDGEYGIKDVCLSLPCVVGETGVERIISADLEKPERAALADSAEKLASLYASVPRQSMPAG